MESNLTIGGKDAPTHWPSRWRIFGLGTRRFIVVASLCAVLQGCFLIDLFGGNFGDDPSAELSSDAEKLTQKAFEGTGERRDFHTHLVGLGHRHCPAYVNPKMLSWWHPLARIKALVYLSAGGVKNEESADQEYIARLSDLIKAIPRHGKYHLLALDWYFDENFMPRPEYTTFYMPNECVWELSQNSDYDGLFEPVISVHPYRPGAIDELNRWAAKGVRYVKWLPNAQGIDASDDFLDEFYQTIICNDMVLITHVGEEKAVEAEGSQELGNPLRFRKALDMGVKIIMAHSAGKGENDDLDQPGDNVEQRPSFELFLRLMQDEKYVGQLYGEISAVVLTNRMSKIRFRIKNEEGQEEEIEEVPLIHLMRWLDEKGLALAERFVNGSDYPLPAINALIHTRDFAKWNLIRDRERAPLAEIYRRNPLEFDYVLKRTLRLPRDDHTPDDDGNWGCDPAVDICLPESIFGMPPGLAATSEATSVDNANCHGQKRLTRFIKAPATESAAARPHTRRYPASPR